VRGLVDREQEIRTRLRELVTDGARLLYSEMRARGSDELRASIEQLGEKPKAAASKKAPRKTTAPDAPVHFGQEYQRWYSLALPVVEQLLPDRYDEFRELYRPDKRKEIDVTTYGIADYVGGVTVSRLGVELFSSVEVALGRFMQQLHLLESAEARLDSALGDIRGVLEAELVDDELSSAEELRDARHLRSAGMVAGVVLERHLKHVMANHGITLRKKPVLANLNQALKDAGVYDTAQWRRIQALTDLRNLCAHDAEREPTREDVDDLIRGVQAVVKTVF
jgi:hypothetical protein